MRSKVAEELREEQIEEILAMTPAERIERMRAIREIGIQLFMAAQKLDRDSAVSASDRSVNLGANTRAACSSR